MNEISVIQIIQVGHGLLRECICSLETFLMNDQLGKKNSRGAK